MNRVRRCVVVFLALLALVPGQARAQGLTGALVGTVKDPQGGVVTGAVVRVTSPALISRELQTTSGDKGEWRFPVLAPGTYALTIKAPGFATYSEEGISINAGGQLEKTVPLALSTVSQAVVVEGTTAVAHGSGLETRFKSDYLQNIPTSRNSMFDLGRSTVGASPTSPSSRTTNSLSIWGQGVNENLFLIDGTNFTCPCQGVSRAEPIVDVIQELHVQTIGASVEYGNMQGGVFNVVTKQGGPHFTSDTAYYGQWSGLTAQPIVLPVAKGTVPTSGYERGRYRDFTTNAGGPVKRDRVWFFGAYQYLRDYDSQPGTDPAFPRKYEQNKVFGKLNWQLTPTLQMMQSFHEEVWNNPTPPTLSTPFEATTRVHGTVPNSTFFHLTQVLSNNTVWEARVGRFIQRQKNDPATGDRTTPPHVDLDTGLSSGNAATIGGPTFDRLSAKAVLNRYQSGWLGLNHQFKAGLQVDRGQHKSITIIPGGVQYNDKSGQKSQAVYRDPAITGGRFVTTSLFASDSFTKSRLTVDVGVRFDHSNASSPDLPAIDAEGHETDGVIQGAGHLYTWNVVSPRVGLSARLSNDGRTMLRATYGRFNQGVLTGELDPIHPGITSSTTRAWDDTTQQYSKFVSTVDPKLNLALDPNTKTPHSDEYSVAVDRQIAAGLMTSVAYIRKTGSDYIGWTDTGGTYDPQTITLNNGTVVPVLALTNGTGARRFLLTSPDTLFLHYDGVVVAMEKRLSKGWQASGSYTYSETRGRQVTSNSVVSEAQFSTIARPVFLPFGQDPNDLTNTDGRLLNDRPHIFRANGVVHLRWQMLVAANFQYFSGKPWADVASVSLPQGIRRILLDSRGTHRLSSQSLFDLRIAKSLTLKGGNTVDILFDVLNLLNDTAEEALQSDIVTASTFGKASQYMDPRRAMIGVRLNLGK